MDPPPAPKADPQPFPTLPLLDPAAPHEFTTPTKRINEGTDVDRFLTSRAYRDIGVFIMQLNRAVCPRRVPGPRREMARTWGLDTLSERELPASVRGVREVLRRAGEVVGEVPPDKGPRRFGNVSFRRWFDVVEERVDGWLGELIPEEVLNFGRKKDESGEGDGEGEKMDGARDELKAYLLGSFGSKQRMDYGTGHELSFLAFLGCLWKLGAFKDGKPDGEIERQIVLGIFEPYLKVIRRLILTYTLEPAGSHGVWGLDDHSFLPYVFGSAQLTRPITDEEPMPLEGSVRGAPKAGDVIKGDVVGEERERNMYFSAIGFINDVKSGPFWEHSPILFDISGVQDGWGKINKGMIKMYNAEVLSKFPVVQHFPFGSLFSFDHDPDASVPSPSVHTASQPTAAPTGMQAPTARPGVGTAVPWAAAGTGTGTGMPGPTARPGAGTAAPWAQGAPRAGAGGGVGTGTGMPAPTARPGVGTAAPWAQGGQGPGIPYSRVPGRGRGDGR